MPKFRAVTRIIAAALTRNLPLKLLALCCALLLWGFIISSDPNLPRQRTFADLAVSPSGALIFASRGFALSENANELHLLASVQVEVSQADYFKTTTANVRAELDLARVREPGVQSVPIVGATLYGKVVKITPDSVHVDVQPLVSRTIPVEARVDGAESLNVWQGYAAVTPSIISVTGPENYVNRVARGIAHVDLSIAKGGRSIAVGYELVDEFGDPVPKDTLTLSTNSVIATLDVYPLKSVPLVAAPDRALTGVPKFGFEVYDVKILPESVNIAGLATFLDGLTEVNIAPVDISGIDKTTTFRARLSRMTEMRYVSTEEFDVTVYVRRTTHE